MLEVSFSHSEENQGRKCLLSISPEFLRLPVECLSKKSIFLAFWIRDKKYITEASTNYIIKEETNNSGEHTLNAVCQK